MDGHVEFGADAEDALGGLGAEPVEGEVAEGGHFFLGSLLEGVVDVIVDSSDDAEAGGHDFKVLSGGGGREDDFSFDHDGRSDGERLGLG